MSGGGAVFMCAALAHINTLQAKTNRKCMQMKLVGSCQEVILKGSKEEMNKSVRDEKVI